MAGFTASSSCGTAVRAGKTLARGITADARISASPGKINRKSAAARMDWPIVGTIEYRVLAEFSNL